MCGTSFGSSSLSPRDPLMPPHGRAYLDPPQKHRSPNFFFVNNVGGRGGPQGYGCAVRRDGVSDDQVDAEGKNLPLGCGDGKRAPVRGRAREVDHRQDGRPR